MIFSEIASEYRFVVRAQDRDVPDRGGLAVPAIPLVETQQTIIPTVTSESYQIPTYSESAMPTVAMTDTQRTASAKLLIFVGLLSIAWLITESK